MLRISAAVGLTVAVLSAALLPNASCRAGDPQLPVRAAGAADSPFDGRRSYQLLQAICQLGPRVSGSQGMQRQQQLLSQHFANLGGAVSLQKFPVRHPLDGSQTMLANLVVEWHPERERRILLCAHYDTRPYPDQDPDRSQRRGTFIGANDGGSGVAVLGELAHHIRNLPGPYGVDFVLFDGEEFVYSKFGGKYFLGSEHFSRNYVANPPYYRYQWGVLLDMVGDAELQLYQERYSVRYAKQLVDDLWSTAAQMGVNEFIPRTRHQLHDDHLALNRIAKIPTCNIIDFDYPRPGRVSYWHTRADTLDKCSPESLAKVGRVVLRWIEVVESREARLR